MWTLVTTAATAAYGTTGAARPRGAAYDAGLFER
jgi:hypothetical protein